jgi:hypothetical protein
MENSGKVFIGKLLRADNSSFVAGCRVADLKSPTLGALVKVPLEDKTEIFGLISNISITDDGLVRQIVSGENIPAEYTADNRYNRNLPVEISVLTIGYQQNNIIFHLLPPRPPLSLDMIFLCDTAELIRFTSTGHFGYFRHILRAENFPISELLATHLSQAREMHQASGQKDWFENASKELITLLRDDYATLMSVLSALSDI